MLKALNFELFWYEQLNAWVCMGYREFLVSFLYLNLPGKYKLSFTWKPQTLPYLGGISAKMSYISVDQDELAVQFANHTCNRCYNTKFTYLTTNSFPAASQTAS